MRASTLFRFLAPFLALAAVPAAAQTSTPASLPLSCHTPSLTPPVGQNFTTLTDVYPELSLLFLEQGAVIISFVVNANGTVSDPVFEASSGVPRLDNTTLARAPQLIYSPAKLNGAPIACRDKLRVIWKIPENAPNPRAVNGFSASILIAPASLYPQTARTAHKEGVVIVGLLVDGSGHLLATALQRGISDDLNDASVEYVKTLRWQPAAVEGKPVVSAISLSVVWSLYPVPKVAN